MSNVTITKHAKPEPHWKGDYRDGMGFLKAEGDGATVVLPVGPDVFNSEAVTQQYVGRLLHFHGIEASRLQEATSKTHGATTS